MRPAPWFAFMAFLFCGDAQAGNGAGLLPACPVPKGYASVTHREQLPAPLQKIFANAAMPGEYFNASDAGIPGTGLLFIWNRGSRWIIAAEHGGIATSITEEVLEISADGRSARDVTPPYNAERIGVPCPLATLFANS